MYVFLQECYRFGEAWYTEMITNYVELFKYNCIIDIPKTKPPTQGYYVYITLLTQLEWVTFGWIRIFTASNGYVLQLIKNLNISVYKNGTVITTPVKESKNFQNKVCMRRIL